MIEFWEQYVMVSERMDWIEIIYIILNNICIRHITGEIEFVLYQPEYYDELCNAVNSEFYKSECLARATRFNQPEAEQSRSEFIWLIRESLKDGLSVIAREVKSGKLVGHVINKLQVIRNNNPNELSFNEHFINNVCKGKESTAMMRFLGDLESEVNLFKLFNVDTMLEITFLGVLPEYRCKSIGLKLMEITLQLAKDVRRGVALDLLPLDVREYGKSLRFATAIFTSNYSKRIGVNLGFTVHYEYFYDKFEYNGKTYAERISNHHQKSSTLVSVEI